MNDKATKSKIIQYWHVITTVALCIVAFTTLKVQMADARDELDKKADKVYVEENVKRLEDKIDDVKEDVSEVKDDVNRIQEDMNDNFREILRRLPNE